MLRKILGYIIAAMAMLSIIIIAATSADKSAGAKTDIDKNSSLVSGSPLYILREYNGRLCVFDYGSSLPREVLEVLINDLPIHDREELKSGVFVYSDEELQQRIEDYDS